MGNDSKLKLHVLIPDGDTILSLSVIRCLSDLENVDLHIVSSKKWVESRFSRKIKSFTLYAESNNDEGFIQFLTEIIKNKNINVLVPIHYPTIRLLSKYRQVFEACNIRVFTSSAEQLDLANNKGTLAKLLLSNGIPHPKTTELSCLESDEIIDYPMLLKPKNGWNGNKIFKVNKSSEFLKICAKIPDKNKYLLQNYIVGYDIDMSVLCENGHILNYTIQKGYVNSSSPYEPPKAIEFLTNNEIFENVKKIMKKLNWTGVAHIDLRYDERTKQFLVIEINPRFWGSVDASKKVGVNFPYLYCLASLGIHPEPHDYYRLETYANNRGLLKILFSKFTIGSKTYKFPDNISLKEDLLDPLPKIFKYVNKVFIKFQHITAG
jgi:D-aspartate ligase